jgi:hypothetical protein
MFRGAAFNSIYKSKLEGKQRRLEKVVYRAQ